VDRYATAASVSAHVFQPGVDTLYVGTGVQFPDALAAVAAAARYRAPVLLVGPNAVPASTTAELARMRPRRIIVLGGTGAISDAAAATIAPYATEYMARIGGATRYETAAGVSADAFGTGAPVVYVVSGATFADAVSAGPAAARDGGPILLTDPATLSAPTAAELARLAPARVVIVGGTGARLPSARCCRPPPSSG
jgi:putative cell wall-binding protein